MQTLKLLIFALALSLPRLVQAEQAVEIVSIPLRWLNVFVVQRTIMIDSGAPADFKRLSKALAKNKLKVADLKLIILTHSHADHAGNAKRLRDLSGAKILVGPGDLDMAASGKNRPLSPTDASARALKPIVDFKFDPFTPDVVVESPFDLSPYGVNADVLPLPGHTKGSQVVLLKDGRVFAGDLIRGELLHPTKPHEHFFHEDRSQNLKNIRMLLDRGVTQFYVGHGGPLDADAVRRAFSMAK